MLQISGYSDDVVVVEGDIVDEFCAPDAPLEIEVGDDRGGLRVAMVYGLDSIAVWSATISPLDEGVSIPWPVSVTHNERRRSPVVTIDCPHGTPIAVDGKQYQDEEG